MSRGPRIHPEIKTDFQVLGAYLPPPKIDPEFMSRIFVLSHSGEIPRKFSPFFLGILYNRTSWGPPTHPSPGWKAPGSAGPAVDGPVTSPSPNGDVFSTEANGGSTSILGLGIQDCGGGVWGGVSRGVCFPVGKKSLVRFFFSPVLMLHKLEDVAFFETRWFGFRYFPR